MDKDANMPPKTGNGLSRLGQKMAGDSGIVNLMDDLGEALARRPDMIFMGGGNPSRITELEDIFAEKLQAVLADERERHKLFGIYQSPQGEWEFLEAVAKLLNDELAWPVTAKNIAVSNGSQSAFFNLFNMFAGRQSDGSYKKIQLPLAPEYLGYADVGVEDDLFVAAKPRIEELDDNLFKYRVDFEELNLGEDIGAICVSRPTNPTGNVLTDGEIAKLDQLARNKGIPLIIDGAYGIPFPNMIFSEAKPHWNDNTIVVFSFSKLGLPGARTGIVVASEEIIQAFTNTNTIVSLASGTLGPSIGKQLFSDGSILRISNDIIRPYYQRAAEAARESVKQAFGDLPYRLHKPEGAMFFWLWFKGLPISSEQLYQRLKQRGVLVVAGHHFFVGLDEDWDHKDECLRVTYSQSPEVVARGIEIIAEEVRKAYEEAGT
ncbi:valine--pyruvate transaminase [Pseudoteredinibacter isoporae]|uniref:valine--pyruvate transaminase n=1 Tax=Pseudoteredinibacter isoporae TaxID=570281 RepID=UPI00333EBE68